MKRTFGARFAIHHSEPRSRWIYGDWVLFLALALIPLILEDGLVIDGRVYPPAVIGLFLIAVSMGVKLFRRKVDLFQLFLFLSYLILIGL